MKRCALVCVLLLLACALPALAQEDDPERPVITPDNAGHLAQLAAFAGGSGAQINGLAWSPNGAMLAAVTLDGVELFDPAQPDAAPQTLPPTAGWVASLAFSPDGEHLVTGGYDAQVQVWATADWSHVATLSGLMVPAQSVALSPDGTWLAAGGASGEVYLWDFAAALEGAEPAFLDAHDWEPILALAFSPDGSLLASGGEDNRLLVWETAAPGAPPLELPISGNDVYSVAFHPGGDWLASAYSGGETLTLWIMPGGEPLAVLVSFDWDAYSVAYNPDGSLLAAAGAGLHDNENTYQVWLFDKAGARVAALDDFAGIVDHVAFSPDGTLLATAGQEGVVRLWGVP